MIEVDKYKPTRAQYLEAYEKMLLVRRFEEQCSKQYIMGEIGGFCHLCIGQEAGITAVSMIKDKDDSTITSYRDHAHIILAGTEPRYVLAELMGKFTGCSKGKGGSMHLFDIKNKFYGGHGIVGAQVPIGTGLAFAAKYQKTNNICYTFLGDGALNQGQVFEAFNMAALWGLPVLYIIENNEYSMGTSVKRSTFMQELYKKGESFGIKGVQIDGMDFDASYNCIKQATEFVRENSMPLILEMKTYRYRGHSMSDPAKYRTKDEVEKYKMRDPLLKIKENILANTATDEKFVQEIEKRVKGVIEEAVDFAKNSPLPDEKELYTEIYV